MTAPVIMKPRRRFARDILSGKVVERIAITRGGKVEVLTQEGETLYVNANELEDLEETNGDRQ